MFVDNDNDMRDKHIKAFKLKVKPSKLFSELWS